MRSPLWSIGQLQQQQNRKENAKNILVQATREFYINFNDNHSRRWYYFDHNCIFCRQ